VTDALLLLLLQAVGKKHNNRRCCNGLCLSVYGVWRPRCSSDADAGLDLVNPAFDTPKGLGTQH
jgi:hypothetical protein